MRSTKCRSPKHGSAASRCTRAPRSAVIPPREALECPQWALKLAVEGPNLATRCSHEGRSGEMPGDPELPAHTPWAGLPYSRIFWSVVSRTICSMRAGQQDSIERIGMQRREGANVENMRCSDRKL